MKRKTIENQKGITLIALVITITILAILASIATYSGINSIKSARFTTFTVEMKIMQTEVNELYDKYRAGDETVLTLGEDITNNDQAKSVLSTIGIANTEFSNYRYYSINTIKSLGVEGIDENEFIVSIKDRKVVSYKGFEYDGVTYYTLESLPKGLYNVEYEENSNNVKFDLSCKTISSEEGEIYISNISYDGYVNKWQIRYREQGKENWSTTEAFEGNEYTLKVDKLTTYEIQVVNSDNIVSTAQTVTLESAGGLDDFQTADTQPYLPGDDFSHVEGTDLTTGLVVTDGTNYWTWIEVPKTAVFKTATSETDYTNIEKDMETYTGTLVSRNGYTDQWYDGKGHTENYTANPNDTTGCGLTLQQYKDLKEKMLSSVYKNGGFWIGQYEAGTDSYSGKEDNTKTAIIAQGKYPYNWITCANAQIKSSELNSGDYTSSLMFGIQWDLVLKHLQVKGGMSADELTKDSTSWGNYSTVSFTIENGEYTVSETVADSFKLYTENTSGYVQNKVKLQNKQVLLTTGANNSRNCKMNIYDIAGNTYEFTLEKSKNTNSTGRGESYYNDGTAASRRAFEVNETYSGLSFRPTIY